MDGVAPHHATERDRRIIRFAAALGGIERNPEGGGNFQGAGHRNPLMGDTSGQHLLKKERTSQAGHASRPFPVMFRMHPPGDMVKALSASRSIHGEIEN